MKSVLVIGSTCVDVIINLKRLPKTGEDLHPESQTLAMGGCAYNVANILRQAGASFTFATPVGSGIYGDYVAAHLAAAGISTPIPRQQEENGCCYCLVEESGERTFLSCHGPEYSFHKEWMKGLDLHRYSMVYICGLEVEAPTGGELVEFLEENRQLEIYFAPGPRGVHIPDGRLERVLALSPVLHINRQEAAELSGREGLREAVEALHAVTGNTVIVTLGDEGAFCMEKDGAAYRIPGVPAQVVDTIGAGDSHIGQILASLSSHTTLKAAIPGANTVASPEVAGKGASLSDDEYLALKKTYSLPPNEA